MRILRAMWPAVVMLGSIVVLVSAPFSAAFAGTTRAHAGHAYVQEPRTADRGIRIEWTARHDGDRYWRDNGWRDNEGDWSDPDWGESRRYLAQYGMGQILYLPIFNAPDESTGAAAHTDWLGPPGPAGARLLERFFTPMHSGSAPDTTPLQSPAKVRVDTYSPGGEANASRKNNAQSDMPLSSEVVFLKICLE